MDRLSHKHQPVQQIVQYGNIYDLSHLCDYENEPLCYVILRQIMMLHVNNLDHDKLVSAFLPSLNRSRDFYDPFTENRSTDNTDRSDNLQGKQAFLQKQHREKYGR